MTTEVTIPAAMGDWLLRGRDVETILAGPITRRIIDADRLVRASHSNGIPNWWLYRTVIAGDSLFISRLRRWIVAFSVASLSTSMKPTAYSDELACVVAWDALHVLMHNRQLQPYTITAEALGVHHATYAKARRHVFLRLNRALEDYMFELNFAYRRAGQLERMVAD